MDVDVGCQVMITSGTRDGDITQLSSKPKLTTGVFNVDPSFGGALANTDTFEVLFWPLTFDRGPYSVHDSFDKVMRWLPCDKRIVCLSLVPDGDMLSSGDTDWTESSATDAKVAASFPLGHRLLQVTATGAAGYAGSANIAVEPSKSYYLEATAMIDSTGDTGDAGTLILREVQSSAGNFTLDDDNITRFEPDILSNNVTMNSTTELVTIRLQSDANGDIISWTNVIFYKNGTTRFVLPDRPQRILRLGQLRAMNTAETLTRSWEHNYEELAYTPYQNDAGIWSVELNQPLSGRAAFIEEFIQPALLTSDTSTTYIPIEELAALVAEDLLRPLKTDAKWTNRYLKAAYDAVVVRQKYQDLQSVVDRGQRHYVQPYA